jgi:hypothetical protein
MSVCEEKSDSPTDLNLFVEDLLEQMVCSSVVVFPDVFYAECLQRLFISSILLVIKANSLCGHGTLDIGKNGRYGIAH